MKKPKGTLQNTFSRYENENNPMLCLIQRVKSAEVSVNKQTVSSIKQGMLVFVCALSGDTKEAIQYIARKIVNLRIFPDENSKMNLSIKDIEGEILIVSQFTLAADLLKGNRPGFSKSAPPEFAQMVYEELINELLEYDQTVKTGKFGEEMQVSLVNDGPVTLWLAYP